LEETKGLLKMFIEQDETWAIVLKETNKVIGSLGMHKAEVHYEKTLGYVLGEAYWGQGLIKEAAIAAMRYMFDEEGITQISVYHFPFNNQSKRVIEKIGFRYTGIKKESTKIYDGSVYDDVCYMITKDEFFNRYVGDEDRYKKLIGELHKMMKGYIPEEEWMDYAMDSDQNKGVSVPDMEKVYEGKTQIELKMDFENVICNNDFQRIIENRRSHRRFSKESISVDELSYLLWISQGYENNLRLRNVPSAGARHPFETYIFVKNVEGLERGLYTYHVSTHSLIFLRDIENMEEQLTRATYGQEFFGTAPVSIIWSVIPYRSEWRYLNKAAKYALLDAGHVCQNLYLGATAMECGVCAIGCYNQDMCDKMLGIGNEEFTVYMVAVGKV
ncbi:GNAT family N-acetyltransferase, partial [Clostridium cadaveris]